MYTKRCSVCQPYPFSANGNFRCLASPSRWRAVATYFCCIAILVLLLARLSPADSVSRLALYPNMKTLKHTAHLSINHLLCKSWIELRPQPENDLLTQPTYLSSKSSFFIILLVIGIAPA